MFNPLRFLHGVCIFPYHSLFITDIRQDGSIGINLINGDTLPTLHFHDDESNSFTLYSPIATTSRSHPTSTSSTSVFTSIESHPGKTTYPPPPLPGQSHQSRPINSWGGEDLLSRLRQYAHILRSTLQPTLFLVDPSRTDLETHTTQLFDDDAVDVILAQSSFANSHSPVPVHRRPRPISSSGNSNYGLSSSQSSVLHRSLGSAPLYSPTASSSQARTAFIQSFSNITRATRHAAQNILSHPLAKPIVPHLPEPVQSLVSAPGEWEWGSWVEKGGVGEFESARVYLARWARIVAEEGERARRREAQALHSVYADNEQEDSSLGIFELLHTTANLPTPKSSRTPEKPVTEREWVEWFGQEGEPLIAIEEFKREVFRRGISGENELRRKVWPFLLGVFDWESTAEEREQVWQRKTSAYSFSQVFFLIISIGSSIKRSRIRGAVFLKFLIDRTRSKSVIASTWIAEERIEHTLALLELLLNKERKTCMITQSFRPI